MSLVVYLALLASVVLTLRRGPGQALLIVYLPALLMIPDAFHAITPGLPDPNFHQAAILPIVAIGFLRHRNRWRPRAMDGLMLIFAVWVAWSDYSAGICRCAESDVHHVDLGHLSLRRCPDRHSC